MKHFIIALFVCISWRADAQVTLNAAPSRSIGQPKLLTASRAPNYVEGREFTAPQGIAVDATATPPILYVADTGNHRVLAWRDARAPFGSPADLVIGQRDKMSTLQLGPGTGTSTGLTAPTGLALDARGNLYVMDSGNNRVLRFPRPFDQTDETLLPDLVIGQKNLISRLPNQGETACSERTLFINNLQGVLFRASIAFDGQGNLFVVDPGNNRVLRFPASALGTPAANEPAADLVLGQIDFVSRSGLPLINENRARKNGLSTPSGLAVDTAGRVYVTDSLSRMLVYPGPLRSGMDAARIAGISRQNPQGQPPPPAVNETTLTVPEGVFTIGTTPWVVDSLAHRIVRYDPVDQWPAETPTSLSPPARQVLGQADLLGSRANRGLREPSDSSLNAPVVAVFAAGDLYVGDTFNNRVLAFPQAASTGGFTSASRVQGQVSFVTNSPNLTEERGLYTFSGFSTITGLIASFANGGGVAVDLRADPPALYVADTFNNRVLGFRDVRKLRPGDAADLVIGQPDFFRTMVNSPSGDADLPNDTGLLNPAGLAIDAAGDLYVADSGNGRVLRFPRPFAQPAGSNHRANLVLGQFSANTKITDATQRTMARPYGVVISPDGHVLVSDRVHNRVLVFRRPAGGDFTTGMTAASVIGQPDFNAATGNTSVNRMISPLHMAIDTSDRLYVCDTGNNRLLIFNRSTAAGADPSPAVTLTTAFNPVDRLNSPHGVFVSEKTGEIWLSDTMNNRVLRFPHYDLLAINPVADGGVPALAPLAATLDPFGNLLVADASNRVAIHFPALAASNGASFLARPASPGMITSLFPRGSQFGEQTVSFTELPQPLPLPRELADVQVLINDEPAPLYFVAPGQINFLMPMGAPSSGTVEAQVVRKSLGQVLAAGPLQMADATPGLFTENASGSGQVKALNQDNTVNSATNAIPRGQVIQLFGTGQGFVPGAPPDGEPSSGIKPTPDKPRVYLAIGEVNQADIQYSGLAPDLVGVWQINFKIPDFVAPGNQVPIAVVLRDVPSTTDNTGRRVVTTIAVR